MTNTLSHEAMAEQFRVAQLPYTPAELHGVLCGALAATSALTEAALYARLANHVGEERWPAAWVADWRRLRDQVLAAYQDDVGELVLLLPSAPLAARVAALAAWCEGFMAGFAESVGKRALPDAVTDALHDVMAISQMAEPENEGEVEQGFLAQIEDHCRMIAIGIFTELALLARPAGASYST